MTSQSELTNNRLQSVLRPGAANLSLSLITSTDLAEDQSPAGPSAFNWLRSNFNSSLSRSICSPFSESLRYLVALQISRAKWLSGLFEMFCLVYCAFLTLPASSETEGFLILRLFCGCSGGTELQTEIIVRLHSCSTLAPLWLQNSRTFESMLNEAEGLPWRNIPVFSHANFISKTGPSWLGRSLPGTVQIPHWLARLHIISTVLPALTGAGRVLLWQGGLSARTLHHHFCRSLTVNVIPERVLKGKFIDYYQIMHKNIVHYLSHHGFTRQVKCGGEGRGNVRGRWLTEN